MITSGSSVQKRLSPNDVGATGGHQSGILIPKHVDILTLLPSLPKNATNPRRSIEFEDIDSGDTWTFEYIYYNGKTLGHSTRDEYRLTGFSAYFRAHNAEENGQIELSRSSTGKYYIRYIEPQTETDEDEDVIRLSGAWTTVRGRAKR